MRIASVRAEPTIVSEWGFDATCLSAQTPWHDHARLYVVDIEPGKIARLPRGARANFFYHVTVGERVLVSDGSRPHQPVSAGSLGRASYRDFAIKNEGSIAARVNVMQLATVGNFRGSRLMHFDEVPWQVDTAPGIRYKTMWRRVDMPSGAEYEILSINGVLPRHKHGASSTIFLVLSGHGKVGTDGEQDYHDYMKISPIGPGDYGYLPSGEHHGLWGDDLVILTAQVPPVTEEDTIHPNDGIEYDYRF